MIYYTGMSDLQQVQRREEGALRAVKDCAAGSVGGISQVLAGQVSSSSFSLY